MKSRSAIVTEKAIEKAERGMESDWAERAAQAVEEVAKTHALFTADDIWAFIEHPREPSALGVVLRRAAKDGICQCTDMYRQSVRPSAHKRPLRVWESRIVTNTATDKKRRIIGRRRTR